MQRSKLNKTGKYKYWSILFKVVDWLIEVNILNVP